MYARRMQSIQVTNARQKLFSLIEEVKTNHKPIYITGKKNTAVLISEEDWDSIQETLYLLSIPKMRESIVKGLKTPIEKCEPKLKW